MAPALALGCGNLWVAEFTIPETLDGTSDRLLELDIGRCGAGMAKWFDETILIRYWEDRCHKYSFKNGLNLVSARRNPSFGRYPDISENVLGDGTVVPAEIEWVTTNFERHGHDIKVLIDNNGFLVVLRADASFLVEQIEIDRTDFLDWVEKHGRELAAETLSDIDRQARRSKEPQIFLYYVPRTGYGSSNFKRAIEAGTWGFPESDRKITRGLASISEIKPGDIVVAVHNFTADPRVKASGGRLSSTKYVGTFQSITGLVVTSKLFRDDTTRIWPDHQYPNRFRFRVPPLFEGHSIPCTQGALGPSLHEILRRLQVNGSMQKIDGSSMTKLMSLCTQ
ncbi:hypothetical protein ACQKQD_30755 [Methylobacterium sp. NPDC080182]|uniref:hypothetical protein n=1 Tax=Methylobacterium sp. NPDC080182 TaxID=3390590 RepID=UPI003D094B58